MITTYLPITPKKSLDIGFYTIPFVASFWSHFLNNEMWHSLNLLGQKDDKNLDGYFGDLIGIGIQNRNIWADNNPSHLDKLQDFVEMGLKLGVITVSEENKLVCGCGRLEIIDNPENLQNILYTHGIVDLVGGEIYCRICKSKANVVRSLSLLLTMKQVAIARVFPDYMGEELRSLSEFFTNKKILISRENKSNPKVRLANNDFYLDIDFCWMLFFCSFSIMNLQIEVLLSGAKHLKQCYFSLSLAEGLRFPLPNILVFVPYINLKPPPFQLSSQEKRLLLLTGVNYVKKEIAINSDIYYWIKHSSRYDPSSLRETAIRPSDFASLCSINALRKYLSFMRKEKLLFLSPEEQTILKFISVSL